MITTIEELQAIIPTIMGKKFDLYQSAIDAAELWLKLQITGSHLFELVATDTQLDRLACIVIANKAYREVIPKLDTINDGNGFIVVSDDKYSPASRDRVNALIASTDHALTEALTAMYEYIEDTPDLAAIFVTFANSTIIRGSLLPTLREFRQYALFDGGYSDWLQLRSKHRLVIVKYFEPRFSKSVMADIMKNPQDDRYSDVIDNLRCAFAAVLVGDMATYEAMCDIVASELSVKPDTAPFQNNSIISFL